MNFDSSVLQVAIEDIIPNRFQPRLAFDDASLQDLANSIKQHGIIQPLVLRRIGDKYEIIAGERRYKAATMAGLASVPAVISQLDDSSSAEVAVVENVQRKDLSAIEEAKSYKSLLDLGYMSQDMLAKKMGLSQSAISNKLRLLTLSNNVQNAIMEGKISERHARALIGMKSHEEQDKWLSKIISERLTVRALDEAIKNEQISLNPVKDINIEQIKQNSMDLPNINKQDTTVISSQNNYSGPISLGSKPQNKFFNNLEDEEANMQMTEVPNVFANISYLNTGSIVSNVSEEKPVVNEEKNEFVDVTPDLTPNVSEQINTQQTKNDVDNLFSIPEEETKLIEEIESLDILDFTSPPVDKFLDVTNKVNDFVNSLNNGKLIASVSNNKLEKEITFVITVKENE